MVKSFFTWIIVLCLVMSFAGCTTQNSTLPIVTNLEAVLGPKVTQAVHLFVLKYPVLKDHIIRIAQVGRDSVDPQGHLTVQGISELVQVQILRLPLTDVEKLLLVGLANALEIAAQLALNHETAGLTFPTLALWDWVLVGAQMT